jgi:hypothetical protein
MEIVAPLLVPVAITNKDLVAWHRVLLLFD